MTFRSVLFASVVFLYLSACFYQRVDKDSFVVTKDGRGTLQSEIPYINDTMIQGLAKYYYYPNPKNVLKDEIEFNNGRKEGWHKHYRKDGALESKIRFKNNLPDGDNYWYYENGQIASESFWIKNRQYGDTKLYYRNGKLKHYYSSDFFDNTMYVIKWDSLGNKIKEEGVVFSPKFVVVYANDSTPIVEDGIKAGKEVQVKVTVAQPPQTKTIIRMGELNKGNIMELPIENYTVNYKKNFVKPGKYTLVIAGEIKDQQGNLVKYDSTTVVLNVFE